MTSEHSLSYEQVISSIYQELADPVLIPNLGTNTAAAMRIAPRSDAFYMWGGMGLTHSIGLGIAMTRPSSTVVVLDGDGSLLMGLSGLTTIAVERPDNLLHMLIDNGMWANTGGQATHTSMGIRLEAIAAACGYSHTTRVRTAEAFSAELQAYVAKPACSMLLVEMPYLDTRPAPNEPDPIGIKRAFMSSLGSPSH